MFEPVKMLSGDFASVIIRGIYIMSKNKLTPRQQVSKLYKKDIENKIAYDEKEFSDLFDSVMRIKEQKQFTLKKAYTWAFMEFMIPKYYTK